MSLVQSQPPEPILKGAMKKLIVKCPECNGSGSLPCKSASDLGIFVTGCTPAISVITCCECKGKGTIKVVKLK